MSLKIRTEAHARKMKAISNDISFMGKYHGLRFWPGKMYLQSTCNIHYGYKRGNVGS